MKIFVLLGFVLALIGGMVWLQIRSGKDLPPNAKLLLDAFETIGAARKKPNLSDEARS